MDTKKTYHPSEEFKDNAHISSLDNYYELYEESVKNPTTFWNNIAKKFYWKHRDSQKQVNFNFDPNKGPVEIKWFDGSVTNICYNLVDRHVDSGLGSRVAYICEGNEPGQGRKVTYTQLYHEVCKLANGLKQLGVKKADRVALYMPTCVELVRVLFSRKLNSFIHKHP